MTEITGKYKVEDNTENAMEMMGAGYGEQPALEIEAPRKVTTRRGGKLHEEDRPAFVKIYTDFKKELKGIKGDDLKVWLYLALSVNRYTGDARPGLRKIAEDLDLSVNTVRSIIERLEEKELLEVTSEDGKRNIYHPSDYVSAKKDTVSKFDTVPPTVSISSETVSEKTKTVSKNSQTVSTQYRKFAQPEEPEKPDLTKRGDLVDGILHFGKQEAVNSEATNAFEKEFGFGTLPWSSTSIWEKFQKFIVKIYSADPNIFRDYVVWRAGDGKYKAFSNRKIRENLAAFMDTGYPEFEASKMYAKPKSSQPEPTLTPDQVADMFRAQGLIK